MQCLILNFALIVGTCVAGIIIEGLREDDSGSLIEAALKILNSCYREQVKAVSFVGYTNRNILASLFAHAIPVSIINKTKTADDNVRETSLPKFQVCVTAASSPKELTDILIQLRNSTQWNHLASFIILVPVSQHKCRNAFEILWAAWKFDLLNAILLCLHRAKGPIIYSFNPFTEKAPHPWEAEKTYEGKHDHPWTLFQRRFKEDENICEELDFDKTNDLAGYKVHSGVILHSGYWSIDVKKTGVHRFGEAFGKVAQILCNALNATCILLLHDMSTFDLAIDDLLNRVTDILLTPRNQLTTVNLTTTYPHWESGLSVVTQYSGYVSQLEKLQSVIDGTSRWGVCLVFLITLLFFKYCLRQALIPAILNNLRLVCNGSILTVPEKQALRLYLASLFLFVLTIQAVYQGKLASLLTKPIPLPNVNTMQDLVNSHHAIYGYKRYASFFPKAIFRDRFKAIDSNDDIDYFGPVLRNTSACCVRDWYYMINDVAKYNLYMSRDTISNDYWIHQIRQDWPLEQRINIIIQRLVEADIIDYWYMKQVRTMIERAKFNAKLKDSEKFEIITLDELSFAFVILGIGLGVATTVLSIEVGAKKLCLTIVAAMNQIQTNFK